MEALDQIKVLERLAAALHKPCMMVCLTVPDEGNGFGEVVKAAPYLSYERNAQLLCDEWGIIVCEDEAELDRLYRQTVCDGPTETNPYSGPARVYALTCGADGQTQNENT